MPGARKPSRARTQGALGLESAGATEDAAWRRGRPCRHELVAAAAPALAAVTAAEELDVVGDDLDRLALGAVLGVPLAPVEASVDRDRAALGEVLRAVLALLVPDRDVEVVRL